MKKNNRCLICESDKLNKIYGYYKKHKLVRCGNCSFVFIESVPTEKELTEYYETNYNYDSEERYYSPLTKKSYHKKLDEFESYRQNNNILDIGCGRGWFLREAKKREWNVYGTEYSENAIAKRRKEGLDVKQGKLSPYMFEEGFFDVVTSFEVMEHINNPREEMFAIHHLLRPGGLFYFTTPNFNSILRYYLKDELDIINYPEHLSYYTKKSFEYLASETGFKPVKFMTTGFSITRFKRSKNISDEEYVGKNSSDEKLREKINDHWYLGIAKNMINKLLTFLGLGFTLKGYLEKVEKK